MSFLSKITGKAVETAQNIVQAEAKKLPNRFVQGGFIECGATFHEPRTNSPEEIINSLKVIAREHKSRAIKYAKENSPEHQRLAELKAQDIEDFLTHIDGMPQRHLSLAHDVVDLSNTTALINHDIFPTVNYNAMGQINGKTTTLMGYVLNALSRLSKENPKAVDLAESVVSHSDTTNSKFFLWKFVDNFPFAGTEKQAEAAEGLVENIAQSVLKGMPSMDLGPNCKEQTFFNLIRGLCQKDSKPENLKLLKQAMEITDDVAPRVDADINLDTIRLGDTEKIAQNLKVLPEVMENADKQGLRSFDVAEFLTKNTNLD